MVHAHEEHDLEEPHRPKTRHREARPIGSLDPQRLTTPAQPQEKTRDRDDQPDDCEAERTERIDTVLDDREGRSPDEHSEEGLTIDPAPPCRHTHAPPPNPHCPTAEHR